MGRYGGGDVWSLCACGGERHQFPHTQRAPIPSQSTHPRQPTHPITIRAPAHTFASAAFGRPHSRLLPWTYRDCTISLPRVCPVCCRNARQHILPDGEGKGTQHGVQGTRRAGAERHPIAYRATPPRIIPPISHHIRPRHATSHTTPPPRTALPRP